MGTADEDLQIRYLKGTGQFVILSSVVTAPLVLFSGCGKKAST